jgi:hypothetical protein
MSPTATFDLFHVLRIVSTSEPQMAVNATTNGSFQLLQLSLLAARNEGSQLFCRTSPTCLMKTSAGEQVSKPGETSRGTIPSLLPVRGGPICMPVARAFYTLADER